MQVARLDDPADYRFEVHRERATLLASPERRQDLWAFEMALARAKYRADITDVLRAGPLPGTPDEVDCYVQLYRAGLDEVSSFLRGHPLFQ
jgi:hypothetical protein